MHSGSQDNSLELLAFNLKLAGRKSQKNILISAGNPEKKAKIFPLVEKLVKSANVAIYATHGTSIYFEERGLPNIKLHKIAEKTTPNILSFLEESRFDLVINILTGNHDYDETCDNNLIRTLCIENFIPLVTDVDVAVLTLSNLIKNYESGFATYKISDESSPWDLRSKFFDIVLKKGGLSCYHAHFDKAYLINMDNLKLSQVNMQKKWDLYKYLKENYTEDDLYERISRCVDTMIQQGVKYCRSFIDADSTTGLLPLKVAIEVREKYKDQIKLEFAVQPLEGLQNEESRKIFENACELADVVGGLPSRDRPTPEKHLDYIMNLAKELSKPVDVHVDQENNPDEHETELLALKTIEHGLHGKVHGVHAISLAAQEKKYQKDTIKLVKEAEMSIVICPSAAISMKQLEKQAPLHNSIAPFRELLEHDVPIYLGLDNIHDLFMPLVDGDMWFECRLLMEAARFYDIEKIAHIATDKSGYSI